MGARTDGEVSFVVVVLFCFLRGGGGGVGGGEGSRKLYRTL